MKYLIFKFYLRYNKFVGDKIIRLAIEPLLKKNNRSKYWLCQQMNMTSRNLNRIIRGETTSISFKYIEEFCKHLNCQPGELIEIVSNNKKIQI